MLETLPLDFSIILILIILALLVWIYMKNNIDNAKKIRNNLTNETIKWLYQSINEICYKCNMFPIYEIHETSKITYTEKIYGSHDTSGIINLVLWNDSTNELFNTNTLIYAMIHEISHILSPSKKHDPPFDSIETLLLNKAQELSYYNPLIPLEPQYVTLDLLSN